MNKYSLEYKLFTGEHFERTEEAKSAEDAIVFSRVNYEQEFPVTHRPVLIKIRAIS